MHKDSDRSQASHRRGGAAGTAAQSPFSSLPPSALPNDRRGVRVYFLWYSKNQAEASPASAPLLPPWSHVSLRSLSFPFSFSRPWSFLGSSHAGVREAGGRWRGRVVDEPPGSASDSRVASAEFCLRGKDPEGTPPQPSPVPSAVGALAPTPQEAPQLLGGCVLPSQSHQMLPPATTTSSICCCFLPRVTRACPGRLPGFDVGGEWWAEGLRDASESAQGPALPGRTLPRDSYASKETRALPRVLLRPCVLEISQASSLLAGGAAGRGAGRALSGRGK